MNTGENIVRSRSGLLTTVAFQLGPDAPVVYALEVVFVVFSKWKGSMAMAGAGINWLQNQLGLIKNHDELS